MDEPLSNLDAKMRVSTRAELNKLHQRLQTTTVYVTHDQVEAMTMGDRIAVMKDGFVQQVDTPNVLFINPVNIFVAGFIGSPAMNLITVTVKKADDGVYVTTEDNAGPDSGLRLRVPTRYEEFIAPHEGKQLVFGLRPQGHP